MSLRSIAIGTRPVLLVMCGALLGGTLMLGGTVFATRQAGNDILPLEQMRTFTDVFSRIKSNYVEDLSLIHIPSPRDLSTSRMPSSA